MDKKDLTTWIWYISKIVVIHFVNFQWMRYIDSHSSCFSLIFLSSFGYQISQ